MGFCKIIGVGNLGGDPKLKYIGEKNTPCVNLNVAVSEGQGERKVTVWYNLTYYGSLAEIASAHLKKGSQFYFEGGLVPREYANKDGVSKVSLDIQGRDLRFIGSRSQETESKSETTASSSSNKSQSAPISDTVEDDDIPF